VDFAANIMVKCSHDINAFEAEELDFMWILNNSLSKIEFMHDLSKIVTVLFQQIKHGHRRTEESAVLQEYAS
jgi:hypothetical protein